MSISILKTSPQLPKVFATPLQLIPQTAHNHFLVATLNRVFARDLHAGELEFLQNRVISIKVMDAGLDFRMTLRRDTLSVSNKWSSIDLSIEGSVYDFMLLASRKEDPDTLFFNRRIRLKGDTELGLYVKNYLDALELDQHWTPFLGVLDKAIRLAEQIG